MSEKINLVPLAEMMNVEGISASEIVEFFDELEHDYARTIIELQMANLSPRSILHENTDRFLYLLRELRDVFKQCCCWKSKYCPKSSVDTIDAER